MNFCYCYWRYYFLYAYIKMSITITKTDLGRGNKKCNLVLLTNWYNYNEDTWKIIKEYAGIYKTFPLRLSSIQLKISVVELKNICGNLLGLRFTGNVKA